MIGTKELFNTMLTDDPDFAENSQKTLEQLTAEYQRGLSPLVCPNPVLSIALSSSSN